MKWHDASEDVSYGRLRGIRCGLTAPAGAALVLGVLLLLSGCGGSPKEAGQAPAGPPGSPPPAPAVPPAVPGATAPAPKPEATAGAPTDTQPVAKASPNAEQPGPPTAPPAAVPATTAIAWGPEKVTRSIPIGESDVPRVFAPEPSPFLFDGRSVLNVETNERIGEVEDSWDKYGSLRALHPAGKAYAVAHDDEKRRRTTITLLATNTGKEVHQIKVPQGDGRFGTEVKHLEFIGPRTLLTICSRSIEDFVFIYDIVTAKVTGQFEVADYDERRTTCSPDGKHLVTGDLGKASIYEIAKGREVARLVEPPKVDNKSFLFAGPLVFSPDGSEIAALLGNHLICWDLRGAIVYNQPCGQELPGNESLTWIPDGSGWLVRNRFLMLREPKLAVWEIRGADGCRFLDRDRLAILRGTSDDCEILLMPLPWEHLDKAVAALQSGTPGLINPGDTVTLNIQVSAVRFATPGEVEKQLKETFTEFCAASGIRVAEGSKLVLQIEYSEASGETREVAEDRFPRRRPFGQTRPSGQSVQDTTCQIHARLTLEGEPAPLWKYDYDSGRSYTISGDVSSQNLRNQVFTFMTIRLKKKTIPYFIPKEPGLPSLPLISDLEP